MDTTELIVHSFLELKSRIKDSGHKMVRTDTIKGVYVFLVFNNNKSKITIIIHRF